MISLGRFRPGSPRACCKTECGEGDRHPLPRRLGKVSQSPTVLQQALRGAALVFVACVAGALASLGGVDRVAAEDVVIYASGAEGSGRARATGRIVDFTGRELSIEQNGIGVRSIPTSRVVSIDADWLPDHRSADEAFRKGDYAASLDLYRKAGRDDDRTWVRRRILAQCVWCYRNLGQHEQAVSTFLLILQSDPDTQYFDTIPLCWWPQQPPASLEQQARGWLEDADSSAARLLGASWLINLERSAAADVLSVLTTDSDPRVALLAEAQLWRMRAAVATADDVARWNRQLDRLAPALRAGPYFTLGQVQARLGQHEAAALSLMRLPILYPRERFMTAEALLAAATSLENIGQQREAADAYREVVARYADTRAADEAQRRLAGADGQ